MRKARANGNGVSLANEVASRKPKPKVNGHVNRITNLNKELEDEISSLTKEEAKELDALLGDLAFVVAPAMANPESIREQVSTGNSEAGSLSVLMNREIPKDRRGQVVRSQFYYEKDDLLADLIDVKIEFTMAGLALRDHPPLTYSNEKQEQTDLMSFQEQLDFLHLDMDLDKLVMDVVKDWFITDNMVLYWKVDGSTDSQGRVGEDTDPSSVQPSRYGLPGISDICTLNPAEIDWDNSLGRDVLLVDIPKAVIAEIQNAFQNGRNVRPKIPDAKITEDLIKKGFGIKWIEAVLAGATQVQLRNEDGDYWIVRTKNRRYHGLANPSMQKIFLSLAQRQMLVEGEFSAAFMMKHFIMLIKQGESVDTGPIAGTRKNWLTKKDAGELLKKFTVVAKAMRAAVNHTTKIEFVFPPKEMFDDEKFVSPENRIFNWVGIVRALMTGDGQNYGGGFLGIKKLIAHIQQARRQIKLLFYDFFRHPSVSKLIKTPEKHLISVVFDENILKEPRQLLEEVRFLFDSKVSDPRTSARELGRDPDSLKSSTIQSRKENEDLQVWEGVGGQNEGSANGNLGGRPANPGTTTSEETRLQPPAGSRSQSD